MNWFRNLQMSWYRVFRDDSDGLMKSRRALFAGNLYSIFAENITAGTFHITLLLVLFRGHPDSLRNEYMGTAAMIQTAASFLQMVAPQIIERLKNRKVYVMVLRWIHHFLNIVCLSAVPILPLDIHTKANLYIVICACTSVCVALYTPAMSVWHIHPLPQECRSDFFTVQSMVSKVATHVTTLLAGVFMDVFAKDEREYTAVLLLRGLALLALALETKNYWKIKEPVYQNSAQKQGLLEILLVPFRHPAYLLNVLASSLWVSMIFSIPYYDAYVIDEAGVSYTLIGIVGILNIPGRLITTPIWNQIIRKHGWFRPMTVSMLMMGSVYTINAFVTAESHWVYVFGSVFYSFIGAGYDELGAANLPYHGVPKEGLSSCLAFYNTFSSVMGFVGAWAGKQFIRVTEGTDLHMFGLTLSNEAYSSFIPFFGSFVVAGLLMIIYVLDKQKTKAALSV